MTVRELCAQEGVNLCYFDGTGWHSPGFFNPTLKLLAIDINLSEQDQKQVALHETWPQGAFTNTNIISIERCVSFRQTEI